MTALDRRAVLAAALATTATVLPVADKATGIMSAPLDPEAQEVARLFMWLPDTDRALMHNLTRRLAGFGFDPALTARYRAEGGAS